MILEGVKVIADGVDHEKSELNDFTIALNKDGKIIFASRTSERYGGATDGFYHDGSFQFAAGTTSGIFKMDEQCAGCPNKVTIDGHEVGAWTLFKVVCPEDGVIITGSEAAMTEFIKAVTGVESFNADGNAFFEGLVDGSLNSVVVDFPKPEN